MEAGSVCFFLLWTVPRLAGRSCGLCVGVFWGICALPLGRLRRLFLAGRRGRAGLGILHLCRIDKGRRQGGRTGINDSRHDG